MSEDGRYVAHLRRSPAPPLRLQNKPAWVDRLSSAQMEWRDRFACRACSDTCSVSHRGCGRREFQRAAYQPGVFHRAPTGGRWLARRADGEARGYLSSCTSRVPAFHKGAGTRGVQYECTVRGKRRGKRSVETAREVSGPGPSLHLTSFPFGSMAWPRAWLRLTHR
jgi:hypothetical protein